MGIEFFECDRCDETICDAGPYWTCDICGHRLCEDCEIFTSAANDDDMKEGQPNPGCPFCRREITTATDLLEFALGLLGVTREQLMERYMKGL